MEQLRTELSHLLGEKLSRVECVSEQAATALWFLYDAQGNPMPLLARSFTTPGVARQLAWKISTLARNGTVRMPVVYGVMTHEEHPVEEFGNIILKTAQDGSLVRLRDVARIEMGSGSYALRSQLNNKDAVGIGIFQSPGANAIDLSNAVRAKMAELATRFPEDMQWAAPYDPTVFVRDSIRAVVQTLLEACLLYTSPSPRD